MIKASEIFEIQEIKKHMLEVLCIIFGTERNLLEGERLSKTILEKIRKLPCRTYIKLLSTMGIPWGSHGRTYIGLYDLCNCL